MIIARSLAFAALFYLWSVLVGIVMLGLLLAPRRWMNSVMRVWARGVIGLLDFICAISVEFRGLEHLPAGPALIGAKHQCMFDTMGPLTVFTDPCYVMKKELMKIPFYGWFCAKTGMIVVDREGQARSLRKLLVDARDRMRQGRQLVIFPEGSRIAPGKTGVYQPGVAGLYRALALACTPLATNSGLHWPAHGFIRRPGVIIYEFLQQIPAGLDRTAFMAELEARVETASRRLLIEPQTGARALAP